MFFILKTEKKKNICFFLFPLKIRKRKQKMKTVTKHGLSITNNLLGSFGPFSVLGDQV